MPKCHKAKIAALAFGIMAFGGIVGLSETGQKAAAIDRLGCRNLLAMQRKLNG